MKKLAPIHPGANNAPMYALCFAAGNTKGGKTALKIAAHLTRTRLAKVRGRAPVAADVEAVQKGPAQ